jgi:hypothetical protein
LAVALYSGTFGLASALTAPLTNAFREALGNPRGWVATSIDQPGKTIAQGLMGVWMALHQGPATADVCMIIGSNPLISIAAGLPQADPRKWLHDAKKRGFKLIVIDPRRHETATQADIYLQPKPAEDIAIVGGMIRLIIDEGLLDHEFVAAETQGLDELRRGRPVRPRDGGPAGRHPRRRLRRGRAILRDRGLRRRGGRDRPGHVVSARHLLEYMILALNALRPLPARASWCGTWARWSTGAPRAGVGTVPGLRLRAQAAGGALATRSSVRPPPPSPTRSSNPGRIRSGRSSLRREPAQRGPTSSARARR